MFDKLIVSESSDANNRRSYFMVSSLFVGILFLAAVVFSIYASDFGLGNDSFEISMVLAPTEPATEPDLPKPQSSAPKSHAETQAPSRRASMATVDEPTIAPTTISAAANDQPSTPSLPFVIGDLDSNPDAATGMGRGENNSDIGQTGLTNERAAVEPEPEVEPPPIPKPVEPKPKALTSKGAINGKAVHLPKPVYPASAIALNIQGKVNVQVMIDESGNVISANAVSGHPFLKAAAEKAAWRAKFGTTYLSDVPVKVTGVIVYDFSRR